MGRTIITISICLLILIILMLAYFYHEYRNLEVTSFTINSGKSVKLRAAVLSDLHNVRYDKDNKRLASIISDRKCDLVFIPGDLIVGDRADNSNSVEVIRNIASLNIPIYMSLGNHELKLRNNHPKSYRELINCLEDLGVHILDNETISCKNLIISGYSGRPEHYTKFKKLYGLSLAEMEEDVENTVKITDNKFSTNSYNILLAHNPVYFKVYSEWGAELTFSGHLHGGIIRLPFIGGLLSPQTFFRKGYDSGMYNHNSSTMLVSRGLGVHSIPIRFNNRPELMIVDIN